METIHISLKDKRKADSILTRQYTQTQATAYTASRSASLWARFMQYAASQQQYRFAWLAFSFFMQGCVLVPVTLMIVVRHGNPFELWIPVLIAFVLTETTNLAAMPTKVTVPVFWAGVVIDLLVIASCYILY
ncbi:hypothetical protein [Chitinophaga rhizophila]|uniref:Uncharacterized protein n=1 Tax=Chitinophaga rhizophila TaxID=2866212 RepID=A0ABS7GJ85_9BACT|nr:hypothetical protein [Chitinophaga rhizophila]MBW8687774.1 hypothetical protein [Chitinophaga rhizophila]